MKHTCKRMTALVLALAMCFSLLAPAWAADVEAEEEVTAEIVTEDTEEVVEEEAEEPAEEQPQEETEAEELDEAEAEVSAAEAKNEEPAEDEGDAAVSAQSVTASGTVGDDNVKWKLSDGTLTISGSGEASGFNFYTTAPWYDYCSSIKSIVIKDNITGIGYWTFGGLNKVTSVKIGSGVKYIEYGAFQNCTSLKSITIPDSVTSISEQSFSYCSSLTSVNIGSGVTTIECYAFNGCTSLKSVTIPANVTTIGDEAFGYYYSSGTKKKISGFTIYGYDDTAAQTYAKSNGFTFVSLGEAVPATPKISSVKNTSSGVKLKWSKVSGATGYIVYRKNSSGSYVKIKTISGSGTVSYTDKSATTNGKKYSYKVKAYRKYNGTTYKSSASSAKSTYRLTSPTISSLTNSASKKMTVKWDKNSKATGYQIQYSTSSDFSSYQTVTVTSASTVSKTISSLTKGKKYYVRVRAYKTVSGTKYYSAWSGKKSVTISK